MGEHVKYKKVIFIDDDKDLVGLYNAKLRQKQLADYFTFFDNASEGIDFLKVTKKSDLPDYILLDLYMPKMNGFDFLEHVEKVKKLKNSVEIFVCTSSKREEDRKRAMKYPFVSAYIEKPLESDFLEYLIKDRI